MCRLNHYGLKTEDVYERIKKDITEFPVFRFDWFFKSRTPQELQRRCNTLLGLIEKEAETNQQEEVKAKGSRGKVRWILMPSNDTDSELSIFAQKRAADDTAKSEKPSILAEPGWS